MKKVIGMACIAFLIASCNSKKPTSASADQNKEFDHYKEYFIETLWKTFPGWASSVGYHKYDSVLIVPDDASRKSAVDFANAQLDSLKNYSKGALNDNNMTDYYMMENMLKATLWSATDEKSYEWDPSSYNVGSGFAEMLNNDYAPINERLTNFNLKLKNVPAYYEAAKKNLKNPTAEHTKLAIEQNRGGMSVFDTDLKTALEKSTLTDEEKKGIQANAATAAGAMKDYADYLEKLPNESPRTFRLGKALYDKKFEFNIESKYTADEMFQKALDHKTELHEKMAALSKEMWPKYFPNEAMPTDQLVMIRMMIDKLSLDHVKADSFQAAIEKQMPELIAFIKEKNILYIDPSKPLVVRREPDYMAGVAGASISAPGPYDKNGNTYYNVGSLSGWDKARAESYLREYNHYILQILNIHEAIPGHYTQLVYSNQSPSLIKSLLGNGAMVEGWAVYTERMMLEEGYGGNTPEMWLMYYKWNLRATCNTILDISVHTKDMSKEDALNLLVNEAFQQQSEAEGKWRRVTLTQVQLCSYFTGYSEIYELRDEFKKSQGDKFSLKAFHEKFLSYGSAPVKHIARLMKGEIS